MDQRECARLETRDGQPVNLLGVKLSGDLRGLMFEASVEQRFCNPGDKNVEVVYSFPLPWGAVLLGVDVVIEPGRAGLSPEQVRQFIKGVMAVFAQVSGADAVPLADAKSKK